MDLPSAPHPPDPGARAHAGRALAFGVAGPGLRWALLAALALAAVGQILTMGGVLAWLQGLLAVAALGAQLQQQQALRQAVRIATEQADGLLIGKFENMTEPPVAELQPLVTAMNLMVGRLRRMFAASSEQVEALRVQAHTDPLTGLANRRQTLARLAAALGDQSHTPELGLLVLRVRDLRGIDRRLGRASTDRLLQGIASNLQAYTRHVEGCCAGRLNGADFALLLPVGGVAQDTAQVLSRALRASIVLIDPSASVAIGAAELQGPMPVGQAIALADEALAQAETDPAVGVAMATASTHPMALGEGDWRQRLVDALAHDRFRLAEFPVHAPDGRLLHLDCPLHVQLQPAGPHTPAGRWLAFAHRSRLCPQMDLRAVQLALHAIAQDGQARCINLASQTLSQSAAMVAITKLLQSTPEAARHLWIDVPESVALDHPELIQEAARRWRPLGVALGLEHAGEGLARVPSLLGLGLSCVRIDSRFLQHLGDASDPSARHHLQGLVRLARAAGLQVLAEGVQRPDDLEALWALGFDGAAGPAVQARAAACEPA
jgi:diguanylate cyclase (GGDEF)-like protein